MGDRLAIESIVFKRHACCHGTHSTIEGIRRLREEHGFAAEDVARVQLIVPETLPDVCGIPEPSTGLEGKFSVRYAATLALTGLEAGPASFTDELVRDPALVALRERVEAVPRADRASSAPTLVEIDLVNGGRLVAEVDVIAPVADADLGEQWSALAAKFRGLAEPVIGPASTTTLLKRLSDVEVDGEVGDLLALTRVDAGAAVV
jgi:2-methylcitrate dehydratase PrpD